LDAAIIVAIIALVASVVTAAISIYGQTHAATLQARREAQSTLSRYREPLVAAAYELQSRLFNILRQDFLKKYYLDGDSSQREYSVKNTLYLVGQYLGWSEILRRKIQFLDFGEVQETREVSVLQDAIRELFSTDKEAIGRPFMIWRGQQRAIGERMIVSEDGDLLCMGYGSFADRADDDGFWAWFKPLEADIDVVARAPNERLRLLQHALIDLIERLDASGIRFHQRIERA
jgi:hypothetical protein